MRFVNWRVLLSAIFVVLLLLPAGVSAVDYHVNNRGELVIEDRPSGTNAAAPAQKPFYDEAERLRQAAAAAERQRQATAAADRQRQALEAERQRSQEIIAAANARTRQLNAQSQAMQGAVVAYGNILQQMINQNAQEKRDQREREEEKERLRQEAEEAEAERLRLEQEARDNAPANPMYNLAEYTGPAQPNPGDIKLASFTTTDQRKSPDIAGLSRTLFDTPVKPEIAADQSKRPDISSYSHSLFDSPAKPPEAGSKAGGQVTPEENTNYRRALFGTPEQLTLAADVAKETTSILASNVIDQIKEGEDVDIAEAAKTGIKDKLIEIIDTGVRELINILPESSSFEAEAYYNTFLRQDTRMINPFEARENVTKYFEEMVGKRLDIFFASNTSEQSTASTR